MFRQSLLRKTMQDRKWKDPHLDLLCGKPHTLYECAYQIITPDTQKGWKIAPRPGRT